MMGKKIIAGIAGAAFCLFEFACTSTVGMTPFQLNPNKKNIHIVGVVTKSGESYDFRTTHPARVIPAEKAITGNVLVEDEIAKADIKEAVKDGKGKYITILTVDGRRIAVTSSKEEGDKVLFSAYTPITIPLSDVQQVWVRKVSATNTFLIIMGAVAVTSIAVFAIGMHHLGESLEESCPFVYSWNGEEYVLDAEPYGAAVSEGLKRTDWAELSNLREVGGKYRLLLTNELDETQYTDEIRLLAVDHAPGTKVAPDLMGRVHTFVDPLPPLRAFDQTGRDVLTFVRENDRVFWLSDLETKDPDEAGEFRDELTLVFPKPAGAKRAKLLANVWTTSWGSASAGRYMELYGSSLEGTYEEIDRHGPMYGRLMSWMATEELYNLKVWIDTPGGWKTRGMIMGGAPVITKDKAYLLDVSDVPGDVLRIKLRPPVNFWMVNSLAVDYGEDSPIHVTEIGAESAVDHTGRDVRAELTATDGVYHVSPNPGERTELVFTAPPLREGLERTVLVKASGYYKVHVEAEGGPRTKLIDRVLGEPGFAARYSFREYLKWVAALEANHAHEKR